MSSKCTLKMTRQRQFILDSLKTFPLHPTADEVYARVRKKMPRISLGTVYRNLEIMAARGIIQKLSLGGSQRRFDHDPHLHNHIRCVRCGALADVSVKRDVSLWDMIEDTSGYEVSEVRLKLLGLCPDCSGSHISPDR